MSDYKISGSVKVWRSLNVRFDLQKRLWSAVPQVLQPAGSEYTNYQLEHSVCGRGHGRNLDPKRICSSQMKSAAGAVRRVCV